MPRSAPAYAFRPVLATSPAALTTVETRSPRSSGSIGFAVSARVGAGGRGGALARGGALVRARGCFAVPVFAAAVAGFLRAPADAALVRAFGFAVERDFVAARGFAGAAAFAVARGFDD